MDGGAEATGTAAKRPAGCPAAAATTTAVAARRRGVRPAPPRRNGDGSLADSARNGLDDDLDGDDIPDQWEDAYGINAKSRRPRRRRHARQRRVPDPHEPEHPSTNGADDASGDTDGDGARNATEVKLGTRPDVPEDKPAPDDDYDKDGVPTRTRTSCGTDPAVGDGDVDTDGDGYSNATEVAAQTDPADPASVPAPAAEAGDGTGEPRARDAARPHRGRRLLRQPGQAARDDDTPDDEAETDPDPSPDEDG